MKPQHNSEKHLVLVFPFSAISERTRLTKVYSVASGLGVNLSAVTWERESGGAEKNEAYSLDANEVILTGGGWSNSRLKLMYPLWMIRLFVYFLFGSTSKTYYCLGFESAFPAYLVAKLKGLDYVFDDADRFSMIVGGPKILTNIINFIERRVSNSSLVHIIPGKDRYEYKNEKQLIIRNTPDSTAVSESSSVQKDVPEADLVVYVNGWLANTRGLPTIYEVAKAACIREIDMRFIVAGRLDGDIAIKFTELDNVSYFGQVSNTEALALYRYADLVFTFYDPAVAINIYAESNKWGDSMFFAVPPIVNDEVVTAQFMRERDACLSVPYHDSTMLLAELVNLINNAERLRELKRNVKELGTDMKMFDEEMENMLMRHLA